MRGNPLLSVAVILVPGALLLQKKHWIRGSLFLCGYAVGLTLLVYDELGLAYWAAVGLVALLLCHIVGVMARVVCAIPRR